MHHVTDIEPIPYRDDRWRDIDREIDAIIAPSRWRRFLAWLIERFCP